MTDHPRCATCRHWLRPAMREDVRTIIGECAVRGVNTSADVGCGDHQSAEKQEAVAS